MTGTYESLVRRLKGSAALTGDNNTAALLEEAAHAIEDLMDRTLREFDDEEDGS
jgi:hypothetical protein